MTHAFETLRFPARGAVGVFATKLLTHARLSDGDIAALARLTTRTRTVKAHMGLVRAEDDRDALVVVLSGFACCYREHADGKRQNLAYLVPGDFFDLSRLGPDGLGALSACSVAVVAREAFRAALDSHPQLAEAARLADQVRDAVSREWLVSLGSRSAIERIAHLFCELLARLETVGLVTGEGYAFPISQSELSATVGLSPVHVNRTLQELRRADLIELKARTLQVKNRTGLQSLGGFRPEYLSSAA